MTLHEDNCQLLATIEESVHVPEEDNHGEELQNYNSKIELSTDLVAELLRQESCISTGSLDEDQSSSEGGMDQEHRSHRSASVVSDASEEGGRDSGFEAEREADMVVPDQDLIDRIVTQVEIYFSDSNVLKDKFLLKHIRRNKEGYVSLKLVSSFKKVKQLTKDWRVVAHALSKSSTEIQINDLGTKIRRITALPDIDDSPVTCTILALNLPLEKPSIDTVSQLFSKCGDIALIRVLKAGSVLSSDLKPLASKHQSLNTTNCAWIEFEAEEAVKEASKLTTDEGMKVVPIIPESQKKSEKQTQPKSQPNSRKTSLANNNINAPRSGQNSRRNSVNKHNFRNLESENYPTNTTRPFNNQRRKAISLPHNQRPNLRDLMPTPDGARRRPKSKSCVDFPGQGSSSSSSSWVQRHLFAAAAASAASAAGGSKQALTTQRSRLSLGTLPVPDGVMRFPKGPDGSKGFGGRRASEIISPSIRL